MSDRSIPRVGSGTGGNPDTPSFVQTTPSENSARTRVANPGAGTTATLIAAAATPANRRGVIIINDQGAAGTANLRIALGSGASSTDFTVFVTPNSSYEVPFGYVGIVTGVWDAAGGQAVVTEITP